MKGFDVLHVKSAVKARNKFDLSRSHLTTMDFGQIVPMFVEETVPGDKFNISGEYFSRLAPLAVPTYGKFQFKTVAGFVPYHQIAEDAEAWLAGKTVWEGQTPVQRTFTVRELVVLMVTNANGYMISTGATATNADFVYIPAGQTTNAYRVLTPLGKYVMKVFNALGYTLPQGVDLNTTSIWYTTVGNTKLSAYPLLAFFKLYNDYMSQSQRFNTSQLSNLLLNIRQNKAVSGSYSNGVISAAGIKILFDNLFLNYENDYFTSAWQNANMALNTPESYTALPIPSALNGDVVASSAQDNFIESPVLQGAGGDYVALGQRALDFLKDFDDWVRRNNYSGSRAVQQIYSRFGIKTDEYRTHYAQVISTDSMPVQVGDITSTADTTGAILGDYAGKGIMSGNKNISVQVSDYGLILILGYFTVTPMNAFGYDRRVLRTNPLDYYNPEFDGIGADAISLGEYWASPVVDTAVDATVDNQVFGYTERYNSYRYGRDVITGEFRDYRNGPMSSWHTGRDMSAIRAAGNLVAQSTSVNTLPQSKSEYNRIFSVTSGDVDHFYMTAMFKVDAIRPMLNLNQVVRLGEGDTAVPRNGNVIS